MPGAPARRAPRDGRGGRRWPAAACRGRRPRAAPAPARGASGGPAGRAAARRRPDRAPGRRRGRRPSSDRGLGFDADPARWRHGRRQDRDLRRGDRRFAWSAAGRRSCSSPRSPSRCRSWTASARTSPHASRSSTRGWGRGSGPTSGDASGAGDVDIVVGTRLGVLAPLADVGLIVVDEEHDAAYKSDRTPRIQARDTAIRLGGAGRRRRRPRQRDARRGVGRSRA